MHEIIVTNRAFGKVNKSKIYLTDDLFERLESEKSRDGTTLLELLKSGRALRGLKHLLESIKEIHQESKLVLTLGDTRKEQPRYFVNYDNYRQKGQSRFYSLYRTTGLDVARSFLQSNFPDDFGDLKSLLPSGTVAKIEENLPEVVHKLSRKKETQLKLINQTSSIIDDLRAKRRLLKGEIDELEKLRRKSNIALYLDVLNGFEERLEKKYPETKGPKSWQSWIYSNSWLFGIQYAPPIDRKRVGFDSIPDFLFPTLDGFIDILEIKLPSHSVIKKDVSHTGAYAWSPEVNTTIGQVVNYVSEMEVNQLALTKRINDEYSGQYGFRLTALKPRAYILIGRSKAWTESMSEALRKLNFSLHGLEVITYDQLLARGQTIVELYSED